MKPCLRTLPVLASALLVAAAAGADELRVFDAHSMQAIEEEHAGTPFLVAVWATDCPPCRHEIALLSGFAADHPEVPVVLIATDPPDNAGAVKQVLASFALPGADAWRFGDAGAERLRYAIDPDWRGEMPRSYFYDEDGDRVGISGPISTELLQRWLGIRGQ
jgi:thiol-disulfide isomerase/thioredoxin